MLINLTTPFPNLRCRKALSTFPTALTSIHPQFSFQTFKLRQNKYLNNVIEQGHRFLQRVIKPGLGFKSFNTARRTIKSYEVMQMLRKGQVIGVAKGDVLAQLNFMAQVFGVIA
jgi:transposase-like protein